MLLYGFMRYWKLFSVSKRSVQHRKCSLIVICFMFSLLTAVFYFSNVGDIIFYYLSSGPLSIDQHLSNVYVYFLLPP
ncbi:hypothetical protein NPIL_322631 [Nephila pilipes]|uniref:Uncharacterized protein n=1 Tax=Nephila pilipes TaxID=299642 RepID=A0A8X6P7N1_NEPPI|nr:hypothetical protein NPIL_322631 [Nephila pilipes]